MMEVAIKINGIEYKREIDPKLRLIDFIRDIIKLKGTKEGCGEGECGACTVIMNGITVNSCIILAITANKADILTIEGLTEDNGQLHPIQQAFMEIGAIQCGYCIPGMVLSAKALLDKNLECSDMEIREGISGNLCRCTGYEKIVEGIKLAQYKLKNSQGGPL